MYTESEGDFAVGDCKLYTKTWTPDGPVKAKLVFVHGFSDHINSYYGLFPSLAGRGIQVFGFDQRGWGRSVRSPADRGLTGPTSQVIADLAAFVRDKLPSEADAPAASEPPLFIMGNSMGGGEVATLASSPAYEDIIIQVRGWILEAPFIDFPPGEQPSFIKLHLGKLVSWVLPKQQLLNPLKAEYFSRDPDVVKSAQEDPLNHDTGTLEGLAGLLQRTDDLSAGRVKLCAGVKRLFVAHGTGDKTTCPNASRQWFDAQNVDDCRFKEYEGAYHQLHSDLCKDEFYTDVGDWILDSAEPSPHKPSSKL